MKKSELLELLKDVEDDSDINETIQGIEGLIKPFDLSKITLDQYKEILENNEAIKGYNTSTLDSVRSKAVETYKNGKGKEAIKKAIEERGKYVDEDVLSYACQRLGKLLATSIKVYPSNMEVFTQDGCVSLVRDNFSVYTEDEEDEVRELLVEKGFIQKSIDEIIVKMEIYKWFSEEEED